MLFEYSVLFPHLLEHEILEPYEANCSHQLDFQNTTEHTKLKKLVFTNKQKKNHSVHVLFFVFFAFHFRSKACRNSNCFSGHRCVNSSANSTVKYCAVPFARSNLSFLVVFQHATSLANSKLVSLLFRTTTQPNRPHFFSVHLTTISLCSRILTGRQHHTTPSPGQFFSCVRSKCFYHL